MLFLLKQTMLLNLTTRMMVMTQSGKLKLISLKPGSVQQQQSPLKLIQFMYLVVRWHMMLDVNATKLLKISSPTVKKHTSMMIAVHLEKMLWH